jgi:hypothetical protein
MVGQHSHSSIAGFCKTNLANPCSVICPVQPLPGIPGAVPWCSVLQVCVLAVPDLAHFDICAASALGSLVLAPGVSYHRQVWSEMMEFSSEQLVVDAMLLFALRTKSFGSQCQGCSARGLIESLR